MSPNLMSHDTSRRQFLRGIAVVGAGTAAASFAATSPAFAVPLTTAEAGLVHPGALHTVDHLAAVKAGVDAGSTPYASAWSRLISDPRSRTDWTAAPAAVLRVGGEDVNYHDLLDDAHAAYQNALIWRVNGDEARARTACAILNAWSATLTSIVGAPSTHLASGIHGFVLANAAELVRDRDDLDAAAFGAMLKDVILPSNQHQLTAADDGCLSRFGVVWDLAHLASMMSIAIFRDDEALLTQAVDLFDHRAGAPIVKIIPFVHDEGMGQVHSIIATGLAAVVCEMAWSQGYDLYASQDSRLLASAAFVAGTTQDYEHFQNPDRLWGTSESGSAWAILHDHYAGRQGADVSARLTRLADNARAEGGAVDRMGLGRYAYFLD